MNLRPHNKYPYTRVSDGQGGSTKTLGTASVIYGAVEVWENKPAMIVRARTSIKPEDVIELTSEDLSAFYEVKAVTAMGSSPYKRVLLDKIDKPIYPLSSEEGS